MRLIVYTDSVYRQRDGVIYGEVAFTLFLAALGRSVDSVTIVGRLDPHSGPAHYPLPPEVDFIALPHYESLTSPADVLLSLTGSLRAFWSALSEADSAWLFGPYLHTQLFAAMTLMRRRRLVLGVRQDFPAYVRLRRPDRAWMHAAADLLEWAWRCWAIWLPTIVVGPDLESRYRRARRLLSIAVSLISDADIEAGEHAAQRSYSDGLTVLSAGRLDEEKNPLLLADILAGLREDDQRWRMIICGEGPLEPALRRRLEELRVASAAELRGHVSLHGGLLELYRKSHVFLHVSHTEGFPQVLIEAFASGVPVVATDVGSVASGVEGAGLLIPPDSASSAVAAIVRLVNEPGLRSRLVDEGLNRARAHTAEIEISRIIGFMTS